LKDTSCHELEQETKKQDIHPHDSVAYEDESPARDTLSHWSSVPVVKKKDVETADAKSTKLTAIVINTDEMTLRQ
jgi:hypothetical protein